MFLLTKFLVLFFSLIVIVKIPTKVKTDKFDKKEKVIYKIKIAKQMKVAQKL